MRLRRIVPLAALLALSAAVLAQGGRRDGNWEVTTQLEMPGMARGRGMPAMISTQCISKEQAEDPQKMVPQPPQRGGAQNDCKVSDYKTVGPKVSWTMKCTTPQAMDGTGELTYANDSYEGTITMKMAMGPAGEPMQMTMKLNGKRLGDCTP